MASSIFSTPRNESALMTTLTLRDVVELQVGMYRESST
jgi:hypothetical protein